MTLTYWAGGVIVGLSSDTKPPNAPDGYRFFETDTLKVYIKISGTWSVIIAGSFAAGDLVWASSDAEDTDNGLAFAKIKDIEINQGGEIRVKFDMKHSTGSDDSVAQVYKNGSPIGTERRTTSTSYVTFSEDFSGLVAGDNLQLYVKVDNGGIVTVRNFRLCTEENQSYTVVQ